jgi:DNA-binding MarR family transcriptional regulator
MTAEPWRRLPLNALFTKALDLMLDEMFERLSAAGYPDVRPSHGCVFGTISPHDGARLTDLAELSGLTKQAVGEAVSDLERLGYVERAPDPQDGRAKIVKLTAKGQEAQRIGYEFLDGLEREWAERFGEERLASMREMLEELVGYKLPVAA